jgi:hypothetical protein
MAVDVNLKTFLDCIGAQLLPIQWVEQWLKLSFFCLPHQDLFRLLLSLFEALAGAAYL